MKIIELNDVLVFHKKIIQKTGGSDGVRDINLIDSAMKRPFMTYDGKDLYESLIDKITAVSYSLVKNHGFVDGNKRIGVAIMLLLLRLNGLELRYTQSELIELGLGLAASNISEDQLKKWIEQHLVNR